MQQSSESTSSTDELIKQKMNNFKERAKYFLNKTNTTEEELIKFSSELRLEPLVEIEVKEELLNKNSFEVLGNTKLNPMFVLNLLNIITIVNFVWNSIRKDIVKFHKILLELKIMFSYIQKGEQIEYALLSTIPVQIYELIASKGKNCFKDKNYEFDKDFLSSDRNKTQIGLVYQENTIAQLNTMFNGKEMEAPTIMYYLEHKDCKKLFESSVFNTPENFLDLKYTLQLGFYGYSEIDHSFILKDDIELSQNFIFNKVMEDNKLIKEFNPNSQEKIKLPKDTNIFVEIKSNLDSQSVINTLISTSKEFANAYEHPAFNGIEKIFWRNKKEFYLFYNNQRYDGISNLNYLENQDYIASQDQSIKDTKVIYNSGYVQITSIVSLQNQLRTMNIKFEEEKEEKEDMKKTLAEQNEKINVLNNKLKIQNDAIASHKKEMEILKFIYANPIDLILIKEKLKNLDSLSSSKLLEFANIHARYAGLCSKLLDKDNKLIISAEKVLGKRLVLEEEKAEFFNLLSLLNEKISKDIFVSCYYEAFKDILTGVKWNPSLKPNNFKVLDIFSKYKKKEVFITILKFIVALEFDEVLENYFIQAMFYLVYSINKSDNSCYNLFYLYFDINDLRTTTIKFIKSLNNQFHDSILSNKK